MAGKIKNLIRKALITLDRKNNIGQCSYLGTTSNYESIKPYGFASIPKQSDNPLIIMFNVMASEENKVGFEYNNKIPFTGEELAPGEVVVFLPETGTQKNYLLFKNSKETHLSGEKIAIGNSTTELLQKISDTLEKIIVHVHPTTMGPSGAPSNAADFTAIKNLIDTLKGTIS